MQSATCKVTDQVTQMIRRVPNMHRGIKEKDLTRLVQAFVIPRLSYVAHYPVLAKAFIGKINRLIRKTTSRIKLLQIRLHNNVEEFIEGHLHSQRVRLAQTR